MHSVGLEPTNSSSTLLQREEVPFELKFIGEPQNEKYHITYFQLKQMCKRRKFDLNINCKNNNEKKKEKEKENAKSPRSRLTSSPVQSARKFSANKSEGCK